MFKRKTSLENDSPYKKALREIYKAQNTPEDGFQDAFNNGLEFIYKELCDSDGGITENYLAGVSAAIDIYNKECERLDKL